MQELMDKFTINELLSEYCFALDEHRFDDMAATFTLDGSLVTDSVGEATGRQAITELMASIVPLPDEGPGRKHFMSNVVISVDGDKARSVSYFLMVHESPRGLINACAGRYLDDLVRTEEGWRFARRSIASELYDDMGLKVEPDLPERPFMRRERPT